MTESVEQLLLQGQQAINDTLLKMADSIGSLRTKVENLCDQRLDAQETHAQCREEVFKRLDDHEKRIVTVEHLHDQQKGGVKAAALIWKIIAAVLGAISTTLVVLAGVGVI